MNLNFQLISYSDLFTTIRNRFSSNLIPYCPTLEVPDFAAKIFASLWSDFSPLSFSFGQYLRSNMISSDSSVADLFDFEPRLLFNNIQHVQRIKYKTALRVLFGDKNRWWMVVSDELQERFGKIDVSYRFRKNRIFRPPAKSNLWPLADSKFLELYRESPSGRSLNPCCRNERERKCFSYLRIRIEWIRVEDRFFLISSYSFLYWTY